MRHRKRTVKLGRTSAHREAMLSNMVCALIERNRIETTLAKAKAARVLADKMITLGKRGDLAARRRAISKLRRPDCVKTLFEDIAPNFENRQGGYTRIYKLGRRTSDSSEMAILEWVGMTFEDEPSAMDDFVTSAVESDEEMEETAEETGDEVEDDVDMGEEAADEVIDAAEEASKDAIEEAADSVAEPIEAAAEEAADAIVDEADAAEEKS